MIIGIARVIYFLGPVLCLATVILTKRTRLAWYLWGFAAIITSFYWVALFSAKEDGAVETSLIPISIWTPMLITTALAGLNRERWINLNANPAVSQVIMIIACVIPSVIAYFLIN